MNVGDITIKLLLALIFGGIIGIERETSNKPAGLRTNILICLSSTMMMILAQMYAGGTETMRVAAGIITGVGFLGAGAIIQSRGTVHGLTTASTIWAVAGLGLVLGAGYYLPAAIFTGLVVLTLVVFRRIEHIIAKKMRRDPHSDH
jgi:putative Mg2+ transporter-C (MgtC) family protein